jgi:hypothetical protein
MQKAFSISEFCRRNGFGKSTYYEKLRSAGLTPREMRIGKLVRITDDAERDWQRMMEERTSIVLQEAAPDA